MCLAAFLEVYAELRDEVLSSMIPAELPAEVSAWNRQVMDYNVPGGKLIRGLTVVHVCVAALAGQSPGEFVALRMRDTASCSAAEHAALRTKTMTIRPEPNQLARWINVPRQGSLLFLTFYSRLSSNALNGNPFPSPLPPLSPLVGSRAPGILSLRRDSLQSIRGEAITREEARLASVLGWCIEWVRAMQCAAPLASGPPLLAFASALSMF